MRLADALHGTLLHRFYRALVKLCFPCRRIDHCLGLDCLGLEVVQRERSVRFFLREIYCFR